MAQPQEMSEGVEDSGGPGAVSRPVQPPDSARNFLVIHHGHRGCPIEVFVKNPDTGEEMKAVLSPQNAGQQGMLLIEASLKELGHK